MECHLFLALFLCWFYGIYIAFESKYIRAFIPEIDTTAMVTRLKLLASFSESTLYMLDSSRSYLPLNFFRKYASWMRFNKRQLNKLTNDFCRIKTIFVPFAVSIHGFSIYAYSIVLFCIFLDTVSYFMSCKEKNRKSFFILFEFISGIFHLSICFFQILFIFLKSISSHFVFDEQGCHHFFHYVDLSMFYGIDVLSLSERYSSLFMQLVINQK